MSRSGIPSEPISKPPSEIDDDVEEDLEANELEPLAPNGRSERLAPSLFRGGFWSGLTAAKGSRDNKRYLASIIPVTPTTPLSTDGVFANLSAKPSSSRSQNAEDEELDEDEWIFMTPEQRSKLPPPKYSRIKRDKAPKYSTEYTPPTLPSTKATRPKAVKPRINSLSAGSSTLFLTAGIISTLFPVIGFFVMYLSHCGRWKCHAARLGSRAGLGLSLFHIGAMLFYIPTLLPAIFTPSSLPLVLFLLWTVAVAIPFGWGTIRSAWHEYSWLRTQERVLIERIVNANIVVEGDGEEGCDNDCGDADDGGYTYIEGTDIRVRDLQKILARARDARLARSLRAAGF
ncbi:hypothetical protein BU17DRAFT_66167 [Hysterangium stoloniferum]|nr:hypothetical protein BU17DRAFT_66167 [Hysterangium stoloniferum]